MHNVNKGVAGRRRKANDETLTQVYLPKRTEKLPVMQDEFMVKADKAIQYNGLNNNAKRRMKRTIEKALVGKLGAGSKQVEEPQVSAYNLFGCVQPPYNLDYLSDLYEKSEVHHASVQAKASNVVGLGYDFIETEETKQRISATESEEDKKQILELIDKERISLQKWIDSSNEEDEFQEVMRKVWVDYEATGNGYLEIGRTRTGGVGYIGHIPARTMRVRASRDGFVQVVAEKVTFFRAFGKEDPDPFNDDPNPNEIIHFKKYSPTTTYYGVPDVISALSAIAGDEFASRFNLDYFENKAIPRHLITIKGANINETQMQLLVEFFEGLKGESHRTIIVPLPPDSPERKSDLKIEPIEAGVQDASFKNFDRMNRDKILMAHRVPISKVSLAEGVSLASARDADKTFKEQVTRPEQAVVDKKINKIIATKSTLLRFKLKELTLTDEETQSKIHERELKTQQKTPNEVRKGRGEPPLPGGDKVLDLNPKAATDAAADNRGNRARDAERAAGATDSSGESRNPQGEGRSVS